MSEITAYPGCWKQQQYETEALMSKNYKKVFKSEKEKEKKIKTNPKCKQN